jgi:hypothetical protein
MEAFLTRPLRISGLVGPLAAAAALIVLAAPAAAAPVTLAPAALSAELSETVADEYGAREGAYLQSRVDRALERALARVGATTAEGAPIRVETTIVTARPNRPTFEQLTATPGLDYARSFGTGGAELVAVIRGADGAPLGEVRHRYYSDDIRWVYANTTWHDAERAIQRFARKVADEVARVAN